MKIAIIDDHPDAREQLRRQLNKLGIKASIIAEADSVASGIDLLSEFHPDLLFLDIQLPDGTGFDILSEVADPGFKLIFTTAYDEYAIKAIRFSAMDYLLKPISGEELQDAMARFHEQETIRERDLKLLSNFNLDPQSGKGRLAIPTLTTIEYVELDTILYLQADNTYSTLHLSGGEKIVSSKPIKLFSELLSQAGFFRVSKSYLVNLYKIKRFRKGRGGEVEMTNGASLPVSRSRKEDLLGAMENLIP